MKWLRVHHDLENEPKIRLVAVESGQIEAVVLAVWVRMMICASKSANRGTLEDWDDRLVGVTLGLKGSVVADIRQAMQGVMLDGDTLPGWEKRQKDKSDDAAARQRKAREKKAREAAKAASGGGHGSNGADPDGHATVTEQSRDKSAHGHVTSESCHVTPSTRVDSRQERDSVASATGPQADPERPLKSMLFGECLKWFMRADNRDDERKARKLIGKWIADYSEEAVLGAFIAAQREQAMAPVSYITKTLQAGARRNGQQANSSERDRLIHGLAGAFSEFLDPGSAPSSGDGGAVARRYH
jgi:hypothetical protein